MKIGVIGAGWWGKNIVNTLERLSSVSSVVVFDKQPEVREQFAECKKTTFAHSLEEVLSDSSVEGVCLATPPPTHYDISKRILLAGKHVLVEKPPAYELTQVKELGNIAASGNLVYMLDALYLFQQPIQRIKQTIDEGELRNLRFIQMFRIGDEMRRAGAGIQRLRQTMFVNGTDVIEDLFFHDAAILLYLFGDVEYQSSEKLYLYAATVCDSARVKLLAKGVPVELVLSWTFAGRRRGMVLYDESVLIEYDGLKAENQLTKYYLLENRSESFSFPSHGPLDAMLDFFVRCVRGREVNFLGSEVMERITSIWRTISDAR